MKKKTRGNSIENTLFDVSKEKSVCDPEKYKKQFESKKKHNTIETSPNENGKNQ